MSAACELSSEPIARELTHNILPFWADRVRDPAGGYFGGIDCEGIVQANAPRSAVLNTRILWAFSAAARQIGSAWRENADWAYRYLTEHFLDREHGGVYWMLDAAGRPVSTRKQIYAQAFAIYGLSEYAHASGSTEAKNHAITLFRLIETHGYEPAHQGYIEARDETWQPLADLRLSEKDLNAPKSMNTHLHVMEAYTNLLRIWPAPELIARQAELIAVTLDRIVDADTGHFKLFFDTDWHSLNDHVSYGHDIEGSWLLVEAAEVLDRMQPHPTLLARAKAAALAMAETAYAQGRDKDGSLFYEADGAGALIDPKKHWWAQAEAMVGFYNAYQMTGDEKFRAAAAAVWAYIETKVADHVHGEWHAKLSPDGRPLSFAEDTDACLAGPWKCPYHNARSCLEMIERLKAA